MRILAKHLLEGYTAVWDKTWTEWLQLNLIITLGLRKAEGYCRHPSVCLSVRPLHMII